ncbi:MAG: 3-deoxy-D-manno-octulosonate 8-phosphate phosphatase [Bacteroidota bacterium]
MNQLERFKNVRTLIFDVDGVLTNSQLLLLSDGKLLRQMNTRDGYALKKAIKEGYRVCIITGGKSEGVVSRLRNLGIKDIYTGVDDKLEVYEEYVYAYDLNEEGILYMGDDLPDFDVMRRVGVPCCPSDATPELLNISQYVSPHKGGMGCVRDVVEKVMKIQERWGDFRVGA